MSSNLHQEHQRGIEAAQVLENPAYKQAMASLRAEIHQQWVACPVRDKEGQAQLLLMAKLAEKFDGVLTGLVEKGRFAQRKLIDDKLRDENMAKRAARRVFPQL